MNKLILICIVAGIALCDVTLFNQFMSKYNKVYPSKAEQQRRYINFKENLRFVMSHNIANNTTFDLGINQFSDLSYAEFAAIYLTTQFDEVKSVESVGEIVAIDWIAKGGVNPIRDQGACGSCYAFSAVSCMEGACFTSLGELPKLSEQQCASCSSAYGNQQCNGGWMKYCYAYWLQYGIMTLADYPYKSGGGRNFACEYDKNKIQYYPTGNKGVTGEANLQKELQNYPLAVGIMASRAFQSYRSGILDDTTCMGPANHAVNVVGAGTSGGQDYYVIRNSWGTSWGESGYVRFAANKNRCRIGDYIQFPGGCRRA